MAKILELMWGHYLERKTRKVLIMYSQRRQWLLYLNQEVPENGTIIGKRYKKGRYIFYSIGSICFLIGSLMVYVSHNTGK
jgi:membrane-bound inhibitor of C-type lysozyme